MRAQKPHTLVANVTSNVKNDLQILNLTFYLVTRKTNSTQKCITHHLLYDENLLL